MIEEVAIVLHEEEGGALVETQVKTTCGQCAIKTNCATSTIAKAFSNKSNIFSVYTDTPLSKGDMIKVGIPENRLVSVAFQVYLLPLFAMFAGVLIVSLALPWISELFQLVFGIVCALLTYKWLQNKFNDSKLKSSVVPIFLEKLEPDTKNALKVNLIK